MNYRSRRSAPANPRRFLSEPASEYEAVQRLAALHFERSRPSLNKGVRGLFPWMLIQEDERALGMLRLIGDGNGGRGFYPVQPALSLQAMRPGRGATPMLCPEGSACNICHESEATVRVGNELPYGFFFVCEPCVTRAEAQLRSR